MKIIIEYFLMSVLFTLIMLHLKQSSPKIIIKYSNKKNMNYKNGCLFYGAENSTNNEVCSLIVRN